MPLPLVRVRVWVRVRIRVGIGNRGNGPRTLYKYLSRMFLILLIFTFCRFRNTFQCLLLRIFMRLQNQDYLGTFSSNSKIFHPCRSVVSVRLFCNFIEIALRHGCSPVNLLHVFRTLSLRTLSVYYIN